MTEFNLADRPWIPARMLDDSLAELSLNDTILRAREILWIEGDSPLGTAAIHRFLLAILHRALSGPRTVEEGCEWLRNGFPRMAIQTYLDKWHGRFNLFDSERPFFQVSGLEKQEHASPKHWTLIQPEAGSNNTSSLFNHERREGYVPEPATPSEAVVALLTYQCFALQGTIWVFRRSAKSAPTATAAHTIIMGENLHETLCLNLVPYLDPDHDIPIWEREDVLSVAYMNTKPSERAAGFVQAYTWPSRSVLLSPEIRDGSVMVPAVYVGAGVHLEESESYRTDPFVAYRYDKKGNLQAVRFRSDRGFWRDFASIMPSSSARDGIEPRVASHARSLYRAIGVRGRPLKVLVVGQVSDRAKIQLWRSEMYEFPPAFYSDRDLYGTVRVALEEAEDGGKRISSAVFTLAGELLSERR
ncbi:type I-E CRISPR-associated protein Cse1/CasA, partial [Candidatus Acetothermia bacterium]